MSAPVENLISRLHAKRSGKGWTAKCPAHDDREPSLSINEGADGRVLLRCHAGCDLDSICAALNIRATDLFPAKYRKCHLSRNARIIRDWCVHNQPMISCRSRNASTQSRWL